MIEDTDTKLDFTISCNPMMNEDLNPSTGKHDIPFLSALITQQVNQRLDSKFETRRMPKKHDIPFISDMLTSAEIVNLNCRPRKIERLIKQDVLLKFPSILAQTMNSYDGSCLVSLCQMHIVDGLIFNQTFDKSPCAESLKNVLIFNLQMLTVSSIILFIVGQSIQTKFG
jgi:hypothetical protein